MVSTLGDKAYAINIDTIREIRKRANCESFVRRAVFCFPDGSRSAKFAAISLPDAFPPTQRAAVDRSADTAPSLDVTAGVPGAAVSPAQQAALDPLIATTALPVGTVPS